MTKTVLLGTTNPAKIKRFEELLRGYAVQFYTLRDLHIEQEPQETGATPRENAELKAKFYGQYFDLVICNDSGLYFDGLPLEDPRQPGLHIRTPQGERLDDEQMISYYTTLVHSLGGRVLAYYWMASLFTGREKSSRLWKQERWQSSTLFIWWIPLPGNGIRAGRWILFPRTAQRSGTLWKNELKQRRQLCKRKF